MQYKSLLFSLAFAAAPAFADSEMNADYSSAQPLFDYVEQMQADYPNASPDELDEIVKGHFARQVMTEAEDGSDLEYAGIVDEYLPEGAKLNDGEKVLFNESPWRGLRVINAGRLAIESTKSLYSEGLWNGNADAYRHCYWNNLMVMHTDQEFAKAWSNAHEENPDNPPLEKWMDVSNNNDGRRLAQNHRSDSDKERSSRCLQGVINKRLVRIVGGKLVPTDGTGRR